MAAAAQIVEGMGADIVDVNMGCPVPKIAKHNAGCSLMREPAHAQAVVRAMAKAVRIPVTVKMRAGWDAPEINAPELARRMEDAGAAAVAVHGRTAAQSYSGFSDWDLIAASRQASAFRCSAAATASSRRRSSSDFARVCRACSSAAARCAIRGSSEQALDRRRTAGRARSPWSTRGRSCSTTSICCCNERVDEAQGFRHVAPGQAAEAPPAPARGRERWVINKLRALNSWYTKGLDNGSHLRVAVNAAESIPQLREIIEEFFLEQDAQVPAR